MFEPTAGHQMFVYLGIENSVVGYTSVERTGMDKIEAFLPERPWLGEVVDLEF